MSFNFHANQYDEPFMPKRLGNWNSESNAYATTNPTAFPPNAPYYCHPSDFIADERGHLLPHVYRKACSSPWGDYASSAWDEDGLNSISKKKCSLADVASTDKKLPPLPRFIKEQKRQKSLSSEEKFDLFDPLKNNKNRRFADPIIHVLREARVPIICIVGLPTKKILHTRRAYAKQLAEILNYTYINLDEQILKWRQRCLEEEEEQEQNEQINYFYGMEEETGEKVQRRNSNAQKKSIDPAATDKSNNKNPRIQSNVTYVKLRLAQNLSYVDLTLTTNEQSSVKKPIILASNQKKSTMTSAPKRNTKLKLLPPWKIKLSSLSRNESPITEPRRREIDPAHLPKIPLYYGEEAGAGEPRLTRDKILEYYKLAMIEYWPFTNGYIIEGFPYDLSDATHFETLFYPISLGIYFTDSGLSMKSSRAPFSAAEDGGGRCSYPSIILPIGPKYAKRNKSFSFIEAQKLCAALGSKIIRIINAESILEDTMDFVNSTVSNYINKVHFGISDPSSASSENEADYDPITMKRKMMTENAYVKSSTARTTYSYSDERPLPVNDFGVRSKSVPAPTVTTSEEIIASTVPIPQEIKKALREKMLNFDNSYPTLIDIDNKNNNSTRRSTKSSSDESADSARTNDSFITIRAVRPSPFPTTSSEEFCNWPKVPKEPVAAAAVVDKSDEFITHRAPSKNWFQRKSSSIEYPPDSPNPIRNSSRSSSTSRSMRANYSSPQIDEMALGDSYDNAGSDYEEEEPQNVGGSEGDFYSNISDEEEYRYYEGEEEDGGQQNRSVMSRNSTRRSDLLEGIDEEEGFTSRYEKAQQFSFSDFERDFRDDDMERQRLHYAIPAHEHPSTSGSISSLVGADKVHHLTQYNSELPLVQPKSQAKTKAARSATVTSDEMKNVFLWNEHGSEQQNSSSNTRNRRSSRRR